MAKAQPIVSADVLQCTSIFPPKSRASADDPSGSGRLTVIGPVFMVRHNSNRVASVVCRCSCGSFSVAAIWQLQTGKRVSCGCAHHRRHRTGGQEFVPTEYNYNHPLYEKLGRMRDRCYNPNASGYEDYGARGITICDEWIRYPYRFVEWAVANGWKPELQIDRIDNDGPYSPENCRYVTSSKNNRNRRSSKFVTAFGETKTMADWSEDPRCKVCYCTMRRRIVYDKWNPERAITTAPISPSWDRAMQAAKRLTTPTGTGGDDGQ